MINPKPPYPTLSAAMKPDLIAFLKTQRRYIRVSDIIDSFEKKYPKHLREIPSDKGKRSVLGHMLGKVIPVRTRNSGSSYLYDNIYSEV
jgi:hypothetical protein